jgi:hypothetical protein
VVVLAAIGVIVALAQWGIGSLGDDEPSTGADAAELTAVLGLLEGARDELGEVVAPGTYAERPAVTGCELDDGRAVQPVLRAAWDFPPDVVGSAAAGQLATSLGEQGWVLLVAEPGEVLDGGIVMARGQVPDALRATIEPRGPVLQLEVSVVGASPCRVG